MFKKAIYLIGILLLTNCIVAENYDANSALNYSFTWCNKNSVVYNLPANYGYNVAKYNNNLSANLIPPVVNYHFVPVNADGTVWHHELTGWYEDFDTAYTDNGDGTVTKYHYRNDCGNFISQCLIAGGITSIFDYVNNFNIFRV